MDRGERQEKDKCRKRKLIEREMSERGRCRRKRVREEKEYDSPAIDKGKQ